MIIPQIKEVRETSPDFEQQVIYVLENKKLGEFKFNEARRSYSGLKIAFGLSLVWLVFGIIFVVSALPVVGAKGHQWIGGVMIGFVLFNFFIIEMFWGGGKEINRSGIGNPDGPFP